MIRPDPERVAEADALAPIMIDHARNRAPCGTRRCYARE